MHAIKKKRYVERGLVFSWKAVNAVSVLKIVSSSKQGSSFKDFNGLQPFLLHFKVVPFWGGARGKASPYERGRDTCDGYQIWEWLRAQFRSNSVFERRTQPRPQGTFLWLWSGATADLQSQGKALWGRGCEERQPKVDFLHHWVVVWLKL